MANPTTPQTPLAASKQAEDDKVLVFPYLVHLEFIVALILGLGLIIMAIFINAPLEALANPEMTPNPAKAPWYFLNLQELLLHMHPSLAGVIVPTIFLLALCALPYFDRDKSDVAIYFATPAGKQIAIFSAVYTTFLLCALILFDEIIGTRPLLGGLGLPAPIIEIVIPVAAMIALPALLVYLVRRKWQANRREIIIALFTGFVFTYIVLTVVGTFFRGPGMQLFWPWDMPAKH